MTRWLPLVGGLLLATLAIAQYAVTQPPPADSEKPETESPTASAAETAGEKKQPSPPAGEQSEIKKMEKSDEQWRKELSAEEYRILREKGTERAFTGEYDEHFQPGAYACAACGLELFESDTKFNSGCGWPAFYAAKAGERVQQTVDYSHGMIRTEVTCARCDGHLGHVFDDAPKTPTGQRYCINSVSLKFIPKEDLAEHREADAAKDGSLPQNTPSSPSSEPQSRPSDTPAANKSAQE